MTVNSVKDLMTIFLSLSKPTTFLPNCILVVRRSSGAKPEGGDLAVDCGTGGNTDCWKAETHAAMKLVQVPLRICLPM